jgi:nanoRNase/pAp phosphatase (c-di-AMP/oligoRNAs hydrolase)
MGEKKNIFIFTDCDLDGAGSYLMFKWFISDDIPYKIVRVNDFGAVFKNWYEKYQNKYDMIYILDLDVSQECLELVDKKNVTVIDHHKTHVENKHKYKHATAVVQEAPSCTKLLYGIFSKKYKVKLTDEQKLMVLYINDYDCYELKFPQSYNLNILYWNYQGDRLDKFLNDFGKGFQGFNDQQQNIILYNKNKFKSIINKLAVHVASNVPIGKLKYKLVSVFADSYVNEVADHIIKNYKADIGFVVNLKSKKVSLRKSKTCEVDLGKLATKLFNAGGGHEYAAGGMINEQFLNLTKLFKPMSIKIGS